MDPKIPRKPALPLYPRLPLHPLASEHHVPNTQDDLSRRLLEYLNDTGGEREQVKKMFSQVLEHITNLRTHVDTEFQDVRQTIKGVSARVEVVEVKFRVMERERSATSQSSPPPAQMKALASYTKTNTGSFRLQDFELHDLHQEAETWRKIKGFTGKVAIPVVAFLLTALLVWIGVHIWIK